MSNHMLVQVLTSVETGEVHLVLVAERAMGHPAMYTGNCLLALRMTSRSDYDRAKGGKLKLKGNKSLFKADKKKKKKKFGDEIAKAVDPDITSHGRSWSS
uniref:Uncharacterized protein n=1 Tax=Parascaris equorum TaxID=6256 RepID=A0A914RZ64_PAREQ